MSRLIGFLFISGGLAASAFAQAPVDPEPLIPATPKPAAPTPPPAPPATQPVVPAPGVPAVAPAPSTAAATSDDPQRNLNEAQYSAIVRVENEGWIPNYQTPWNAGGAGGGIGTGFLVGPNQFLTNAHVVSSSRLLYIKKVDDPTPFEAEIQFIAHDCDLALLKIKDEAAFTEAFKGVEALKFGDIPPLDSTVVAVGYPIGGARISVTRGVVSRIDFRAYAHSNVDYHLTVQIDAAINPGNSGGPVIQDQKVVGVAFQAISGNVAQNTSYMIPTPVIRRFLQDVKDGEYNYYPDLAVSHFSIQNPAQRKALKLPNNGIGVFVTNSDSAGSAGDLLKTGDIIIAMDGQPVGSDGFVSINGARINMNEIVERKYVNDNVKLTILRDGKQQDVDVKLNRFLPYLIQANIYDQDPQFVMFAGLVFQPVDRNLLAARNITNLQVRYMYNYYAAEEIYKERPQIVVLTQVLPDPINTHLDGFVDQVVDEINGVKIRTMKDVHKALYETKPEGDFHVISLLGEGRPIVLDKNWTDDANKRVKEKYNVVVDHRLGPSLMGD